MSATKDSSLLPPLHPPQNWIPPIQVQPSAHPLAPEPGRIIFTRQLWQRTMPEDSSEHGVSTRSQSQGSLSAYQANASTSRRASSNVSTRSLRSAPSILGSSKAPLTPEESPPSRPARKRSVNVVEEEDRGIDSHEVTPIHTRVSSGDSTAHVCICQPDPKIPRPRNAFILYRQHHQAKVVAQHPGLANPEISKIIGEQWRNQSAEVKNGWKALAEEEKLRHQQQYPTYRYQPKRSGRRNSTSSETPGSAGEKAKCNKCGGRTILAPSTPYAHGSNVTSPSTAGLPPGTPSSAPTPISRTLPFLRDLSLQSPASRPMRYQTMPPNHHLDERDDLGPLSPDFKRRRFNGENHQPTIHRVMPPRYGAVPAGMPVGPGTPFPFGQAAHAHPQNHPQMFAPVHVVSTPQPRRESLPGLRGVTGASTGAPATAKSMVGQSVDEVIMSMPFEAKLGILRKIAPPRALKKRAPRGPLIAIEGDNAEAVERLAKWLSETLRKDSELTVKLLDGPDIAPKGNRDEAMAEYHVLVAHWLGKSKTIMSDLEYNIAGTPDTAKANKMDTSAVNTPTPASGSREVGENYDNEEGTPPKHSSSNNTMQIDSANPTAASSPKKTNSITDIMDVDDNNPTGATTTTKPTAKPIAIVPLFSLHASNTFACRIPLIDTYAPNDHWSWNATQWRGVVGADLTIYLKDGEEKGKMVEQSEEERLFVVRRGADADVDGSTLRRVGFEVVEWVRAFGEGV
ncbi:hypothetical protein Q7P35_006573 [Cladosporium inversicolor]